MKTTLLILCLLSAICVAGMAQTSDVPRDHWAYDAVRDLADKGYVLGYPDGNFLGNRTLTRYEFATVVKRVIDNLEARLDEVEGVPAPAPTTQPAPPAQGAVGMDREDVEKLARLLDEFKVELTVIGTKYEALESTMADLEARVDTMNSILTDEEGALKTVISDVSKLKKVTVSGYLQARLEDAENKEDKVGDVPSSFYVRRARIKVTAKPTDKMEAVLQLEMGKNKVGLKDSYIGYALGENFNTGPAFYVGQMNWPFGYETPYSSSRRETPERALFIRRFFPGERDQGAKLAARVDAPFNWQIGLFNGTGIEGGSGEDKDNYRDIVLDLGSRAGDLNWGVSAYYGKGVWEAGRSNYITDVDKIRYGANVQYYAPNITLKAEYVRGKGVDEAVAAWDQKKYVDGYYAQLNYSFTPSDILVGRYSVMSEDPKAPTLGRRTSWDIGYIRWLDDKTRLKLFYKINKEQFNEFRNDVTTAEWIVTY